MGGGRGGDGWNLVVCVQYVRFLDISLYYDPFPSFLFSLSLSPPHPHSPSSDATPDTGPDTQQSVQGTKPNNPSNLKTSNN